MTRNNLDQPIFELEDINNNGNIFGCTESDEVVTLWINSEKGGKRVCVNVFKKDLSDLLKQEVYTLLA